MEVSVSSIFSILAILFHLIDRRGNAPSFRLTATAIFWVGRHKQASSFEWQCQHLVSNRVPKSRKLRRSQDDFAVFVGCLRAPAMPATSGLSREHLELWQVREIVLDHPVDFLGLNAVPPRRRL